MFRTVGAMFLLHAQLMSHQLNAKQDQTSLVWPDSKRSLAVGTVDWPKQVNQESLVSDMSAAVGSANRDALFEMNAHDSITHSAYVQLRFASKTHLVAASTCQMIIRMGRALRGVCGHVNVFVLLCKGICTCQLINSLQVTPHDTDLTHVGRIWNSTL